MKVADDHDKNLEHGAAREMIWQESPARTSWVQSCTGAWMAACGWICAGDCSGAPQPNSAPLNLELVSGRYNLWLKANV